MQFAHPTILYATFPLLIGLGLFFWLAERRSAARLQAFASPELLGYLSQNASPQRRILKAILFLLASACAGFALARPQWGVHLEEREGRGIDIVFALDTSRSMAAEDIRPNRLERAKLSILDFVDGLHGDRVGLIAFAGRAFLQCPLTLDYDGFRNTLQAVDTEIIPLPGTNIGGAIREANAAMVEDRNHRILVIITDGEDLEAEGVREARRAAEAGMVIHTVGVGSTEGAPIPRIGPNGARDYHRDMDGNIVLTKVDEATLMTIAAETGGSYTSLGVGEGLEAVYKRIREAVPPEETGTQLREVPIERFQWFLAMAILLFSLERILSTRRRRIPATTIAALAIVSVLLPPQVEASSLEGQRLFDEGRYTASAEAYARALERRPNDASLLYNYGVSLYRSKDYKGAREAFEKALLYAKPEVQERAFFNLGNSLYHLGKEALGEDALAEDEIARAHALWTQAKEHFESARELNPNATDATANAQSVAKSLAVISRALSIETSPPGGGSVTGAGSYARGSSASIKASANEGWRFLGWHGESIEDPESSETTVLMDEDRAIAASFIRTWKLTVDAANPDLGTAGESGTYDEGAEIPITAEAFEDYAFKRWETENDQLEIADKEAAETTVRLRSDSRITAHFVDAYRLTVRIEPELGGRAGNSGFYEIDSLQPIKAEPREGFIWKEWRGEGISDPAAPETTISMTQERRVTALVDRAWSLILIPVEEGDERTEGGGMVEGGGMHPVGARVPIQAIPAEGYLFDHWEGPEGEDPGVENPTAATTHVTVQSEEHDLFAIFRPEDSDSDEDEGEDQEESEDSSQGDDEQESGDSEDQSEGEDQEDETQEPESEQEEDEPDDSSSEAPGEEEQQEAAQEEAPGAEVPLSPEEAEHILNLLDDQGKVLPLSEEPADFESRSTGRDW